MTEARVAERLLRAQRTAGPPAVGVEAPRLSERLGERGDCVLDRSVGTRLELEVGALSAGRPRDELEPERAAILDHHLSLHISPETAL